MLIITVIGPHLYPVQTYFLSEMIALMMSYLNTANEYLKVLEFFLEVPLSIVLKFCQSPFQIPF